MQERRRKIKDNNDIKLDFVSTESLPWGVMKKAMCSTLYTSFHFIFIYFHLIHFHKIPIPYPLVCRVCMERTVDRNVYLINENKT